jgi:magnesium-protoporphyrin O-methyltransferase
VTACRCDQISSRFDEVFAREKLARYRAHGPDPSTRALLEAISVEDIRGKTLLDIGGGVGAVQHELLRLGVAWAQEVEASTAYVAACQAEAGRQGHGDRIIHLSGDFGSVADAVEPADIVTLDRSVCCWHDPLTLIDQSAAKARWLYGLVYPRDVWWVRYGWRHLGNARQVLKRSGLRLTTPRAVDVARILDRHHLHLRRHAEIGVWQIAVFARDASLAA